MTSAAQEMYVAQSAVSASIAQLEQVLGCELLQRHRSRGVTLTDHGRTFYGSALEILAAVDGALDAVRADGLTGRLDVGCFTTLAPTWVPEIHERLLGAYPDLEVRIHEVTAEEVEPMLTRRDLEAVLTYGFDYGRPVGFTRLAEAPVHAAFHETSPFARRESVDLAELADEPLILLDLGKSSNYFLSLFHEAHLVPRVHQRFESVEVVRAMVAKGHGYTILNQHPAHDLAHDGARVVRRSITGVRSHLQMGIATREGESLSRKGGAFAAACRQAMAGPNGGPASGRDLRDR